MKITIDVEFKDAQEIKVLPEEGMQEEDYTKEELVKFKEGYRKDLIEYVIRDIENYLEEGLCESIRESEQGIEDYDTLEDYGIKIKVNKEETIQSAEKDMKK